MMPNPDSDAADDLKRLVDIAQQMSETFELEPLLRSVEQAGRAALGSERATILLYDAQQDELYSTVATGTTGEIRFSAKLGIAGEAAQTRSIVAVPDAYADQRFNPEIDRQTGYHTRNLFTLPLITPDGQLIGVLQVLNKKTGQFTAADERLAVALGSLAGLAIKRQMLLDEAAEKQKLERDLNIARTIQQNLLPERNPAIQGFDIAGWNRPADQTGGDCYDFFSVRDDRLAILVADATGHGIGPALIVAQCRSLLRALGDTSDDLGAVVGKVNNLLCEDLPSDRFVTMFFGVLDAPARRLDYVSAGHGPQLYFRAATGEAEAFSATGLPMGIMPDAQMQLAPPIRFESGDMFMVVTDGFSEWSRPDGQQYGEERLIEVVRKNRARPCVELISLIYQDVRRFSEGSPQMDDLTIVLIKRTEP